MLGSAVRLLLVARCLTSDIFSQYALRHAARSMADERTDVFAHEIPVCVTRNHARMGS